MISEHTTMEHPESVDDYLFTGGNTSQSVKSDDNYRKFDDIWRSPIAITHLRCNLIRDQVEYDPSDVEYLINSNILAKKISGTNLNRKIISCNIEFVCVETQGELTNDKLSELETMYDDQVRSKHDHIHRVILDKDHPFYYTIILTFGNV